MKCVKCNGIVGPGLHLCADGAVVHFQFENDKPSIWAVQGRCVSCGHRCALRDTAVDPDKTTPLCPVCGAEWRAISATEKE